MEFKMDNKELGLTDIDNIELSLHKAGSCDD